MCTLTGVFYYSIGNFSPALRSTHRSIHLVAVVSCPLLRKHGFKEVLKPFIVDVNKLYNVSSGSGIELVCDLVTSVRMVLWSATPNFLVLPLHFWQTHWLLQMQSLFSL